MGSPDWTGQLNAYTVHNAPVRIMQVFNFRVGWVDFMFSTPDLPTLYSETQSGRKTIKIIKNLH